MDVEWSPEALPDASSCAAETADLLVGLLGGGVDELDGRALASRLADVERVIRRFEGVAASIVASAERREVFAEDGHVSVRGCVKASIRLSDAEVTHRVRTARLLARCQRWSAAMASGGLGLAQLREAARVAANRRCGQLLDDVAEAMITVATSVSFEQFCRVIRGWEQLTDSDGAHRNGDHAHDSRSASWRRVGDVWHLDGRFGAAQGAAIAGVLDRFTEAQTLADWDDAKVSYAEAADASLLARTPAQRRADALAAVCDQAASTSPGGQAPTPVVNYVVDQQIFEEQLAALFEDRRTLFDTSDLDRLRCHSTDGHPADPADVVAAALFGHVRRVVLGADGVIIDLGRRRRLFTGSARDAALLQAALDRGRRCLWPGCRHRTCQIDHRHEWHHDGLTDVANSGPLCGRHNRHKTRGYHTWRKPDGTWHVRAQMAPPSRTPPERGRSGVRALFSTTEEVADRRECAPVVGAAVVGAVQLAVNEARSAMVHRRR